jgi:23S rRNA (pseudouridine1915-N3)-methyltransferase
MKIHIYPMAVSVKTPAYADDAQAEYIKRLSRFAQIKIQKPTKKRSGNPVVQTDRRTLFVIDPKGESISSENLAAIIDAEMLRGTSTFVFTFDEEYQFFDYRVSLTSMTMDPFLMQIVLLEQIYRAFKIISNETYHK